MGCDICLCIQFNKESGKEIEECKLKVFYMSPSSAQGNSEDEGLKSSSQQSPDSNSVSLIGDLLYFFFEEGEGCVCCFILWNIYVCKCLTSQHIDACTFVVLSKVSIDTVDHPIGIGVEISTDVGN